MPDQPSQQEMSWPDLARALIWLATDEGVPAMQQIEAAILVLDAAEASDKDWPAIEREIRRLLGSRAVH